MMTLLQSSPTVHFIFLLWLFIYLTEENCILFGKSELFSALSSMCLLSLYSFRMLVCEWLYLVDVHGKVPTPD